MDGVLQDLSLAKNEESECMGNGERKKASSGDVTVTALPDEGLLKSSMKPHLGQSYLIQSGLVAYTLFMANQVCIWTLDYRRKFSE